MARCDPRDRSAATRAAGAWRSGIAGRAEYATHLNPRRLHVELAPARQTEHFQLSRSPAQHSRLELRHFDAAPPLEMMLAVRKDGDSSGKV